MDNPLHGWLSIPLAALTLGLFALAGVGLVSATHETTRERIQANQRLDLLRKLQALVPADSVDNDMAQDLIRVHDAGLLGAEASTVYRGRRQGQPVAVVLTATVPDGYAGPIQLLVAVRADGTLGGVRVVSHKETPGLGDKIEEEKSDWIQGFTNRSLQDPGEEHWGVKRDGGHFDQFAGATVTPRAVVRAIKNSLLYVRAQGVALYQPAPGTAPPTGGKS